MRTLAALLDMTCWIWRRWLCEAIDRIRPGYGHSYALDYTDPAACRFCGMSRAAIRRRTH